MSIEEQKAAQAVAWAIQLADGSISPYGWSDMRTFVATQKYMVLDDGCTFVFAYRTPYTHEDVMRLVDSIRTVYAAIPDLPVTEETIDAATDVFSLFCVEFNDVLTTHQEKDGPR